MAVGSPFFVIGAKGAPMGVPIDFVSIHKSTFINRPAIIPRKPAAAPRKMYTNRRIRAASPR